MKKKCPNCGFVIKKFDHNSSKKNPQTCSQCGAQLYFPIWIDWLQNMFGVMLPPVSLLLFLLLPLKVFLPTFAFVFMLILFFYSFFKPKILKKSDEKLKK